MLSDIQKGTRIKKPLIYCGFISSLVYFATDTISGFIWPDYSFSNQTVSELFAIGSPTKSIVVPLFIFYSLLIYLFGFGIWISSGTSRNLKIASILIVGKEVLGLFGTLFAPIHLRGVQGTLSDTLHAVITGVGVLLFMFPAMWYGSLSFGKKFQIYSISTMVTFIVFGTLAGLNGPELAKNLPTPYMGLWERINIYGYMLWIVILSKKILERISKIVPG